MNIIQHRTKGLLIRHLGYLFFIFMLASCIEYSPYEIRLEEYEHDINNTSILRIESLPETDTVKFIFGGDAQRFFYQAHLLVESVNGLPHVQFVALGGDFTDFGIVREFQAMHEIFCRLNVPYVSLVGNHDMLYNGKEIYQKMYGDFDFSFIVSRIKFIAVNTNSREFGFPGNVPDISFLERELEPSADFDKAVVMCHVPPGNDDFDNNLEEEYANAVSKHGNVALHINAHVHDFTSNHPYDGTVHYLNSFALELRKYLYIKVWNGPDSDGSHSFDIIEY